MYPEGDVLLKWYQLRESIAAIIESVLKESVKAIGTAILLLYL